MYLANDMIAASLWLRVRTELWPSLSRWSRNDRTVFGEMSETRSESTPLPCFFAA